MSNYKIIIIIRFSIYPVGHKYDLNRLNYRFLLFENICLPSLVNQKNKDNYVVVVKIAKGLPVEYKEKLEKLIESYNFVHMDDEPDFNIIKNKHIDETTKIVSTVRFDDDDALNLDFVSILSKYCNEKYINKVISFPQGAFIRIDKKNITYQKIKSPLIACGLALITDVKSDKHIHSVKHREWDKKGYKCIYDNHPMMYIVTNHKYGREGRFNNKSGFVAINEGAKKVMNFIDFDKLVDSL